MQVLAILKAVLAALKLGKKYWPVVAVVLAMIAKVASGDTSGLSESFAAIVAAIAAANGANRADKAEKAIGKARASGIADVMAVAVRKGKEDSMAATIGELEGGGHVKLVPVDVPELVSLSFYPTDLRGPDWPDVASKSAPPFRFADVAPYLGVQITEDK